MMIEDGGEGQEAGQGTAARSDETVRGRVTGGGIEMGKRSIGIDLGVATAAIEAIDMTDIRNDMSRMSDHHHVRKVNNAGGGAGHLMRDMKGGGIKGSSNILGLLDILRLLQPANDGSGSEINLVAN